MPTMAQAIRAYVQDADRKVTADDIKRYINAEFAGQWKASTLQAHLYACVVNNPKAYVHHPSADRFLYRNSDGTFEIYSESTHGPNEWAPTTSNDDESTELDDLVETSITLERDIEEHLARELDSLEAGLRLTGRQVSTDVGCIDLLAEDANGSRVVIEIKVGEAKDSAVGQIARYLGWYRRTEPRGAARGILVAASFSEGLQYAAAAIPNLKLVSYRVHFSFEEVGG